MSTLVLTEEQEALKKTTRDFVAAHLPASVLRSLRDTRDGRGYLPESWRQMAELGLVGIPFSEDYGGTGLGFAELGIVLEECGRQLSPVPFISTVVLGGGAIAAGSEAQRRQWLPGICSGTTIVALAHEEGNRHAPLQIATSAKEHGAGFVLSGDKVFVLDGQIADALIVVARTAPSGVENEGLSLFVVPAKERGVSIERSVTVDSRGYARVHLQDVVVGSESLLGKLNEGARILGPLLDRARIALAAEMLGGIQEAFAKTLLYLKVRKQFGVPIGSFQALKHRAAQMFCEVELTRSVVLEALRAVDEQRADVATLASAAKARATDTFLLVANEAIQMHGGIGVTDELDIGFYLKRARVCEQLLGNSAFHRDRYARLQGY